MTLHVEELVTMKLKLEETMWVGDGAALGGNPIQYEVRGLPPGQDQMFIEQNVSVKPRTWKIRRRDGVRDGESNFATPQDALASLEAEFFGEGGA
jgi:hypothetical protein